MVIRACSSFLNGYFDGSIFEGHAQKSEQFYALFIGIGIGDESDIHPLCALDLIEVKFWENLVVIKAKRVVSSSIAFGIKASEVTYTW